jgi:putative ABC transport system permease protein
MDSLFQDLRFGARTLRRNAGFATVAVLTLALGIGANAAIFSVVDAVLLRPLPWADPDRAVVIWSRWNAFDKTWVADGEVNDYRRENRTMTEIAAWDVTEVNLTGNGDPERVRGDDVTANTFSALGVTPMFGRVFTEAEDRPNGPNAVILSAGLWQRRYGGDPSIVGRTIQIDGQSHEVVGVMPPEFKLPTDFRSAAPTALWLPSHWDASSTDHGSHGFYAVGRLKPGVTLAQAQDDFHRIVSGWIAKGLYPPQMGFDNVLVSAHDEVVGAVRRPIWLLFGAVGFLLLIACANVANLLLARAEARQREIAVRSALGAGAWRIVRQLVTESLLLASVSAAAGLLLAGAGVRVLAWWNPSSLPRVAGVSVDARVLAFTVLVALVTTVVFSVAPAARLLRVGLTEGMKDGSANATTGGGRRQFRDALVVAEMALAVVLLTGAGLMLRTLWSLQHIDLGFRPAGVLTMRVSLPPTSYKAAEDVVGFYMRLNDGVRAIPGVVAAGAARALPLGSTIGDWGAVVDGYTPPPGASAKGDWEIVTDGYIEAMGERILRGRSFTAADGADSRLVGLINEEMARRYWKGRDPLGGRFRISRRQPLPWITVVGIVKDVQHNGVTVPTKEKFYIAQSQWSRAALQIDGGAPVNAIRSMTLVVKSATDPSALTSSVRDIVRRLDSNLPVADVRTMNDVVGAALSTPRFTSVLLSIVAALALTLSAIGTYGVLSYVVSRRTREIGIRVAIGAGRWQVLRMVMIGGVSLALAGIGAGLVMAIGVTRLLRGLLHGVTPLDPATFVTVGAGLTAVAALASLVPAWRATRVNPVVALKSD